MKDTTTDPLSATFAALADPTRRALLRRLARGPATVKELAAPFAISGPAISRHLRVLERAGLVRRGRDAQRRPRTLEPGPIGAAVEWAEPFRRLREEGPVPPFAPAPPRRGPADPHDPIE